MRIMNFHESLTPRCRDGTHAARIINHMEREFVVKVILSRTDPDAKDGMYIPLVVRAQTATAALNTFAQRSNASVVYSLDNSVAVRGAIGVDEKVFPVIVSPRREY
jgi:hypothetical protein